MESEVHQGNQLKPVSEQLFLLPQKLLRFHIRPRLSLLRDVDKNSFPISSRLTMPPSLWPSKRPETTANKYFRALFVWREKGSQPALQFTFIWCEFLRRVGARGLSLSLRAGFALQSNTMGRHIPFQGFIVLSLGLVPSLGTV
jgi:hypothetical protein